MRMGIVVDDWKLFVFKKHLEGVGLYFEVGRGSVDGVSLLTIVSYSRARIESVVEAAEAECKKMAASKQ